MHMWSPIIRFALHFFIKIEMIKKKGGRLRLNKNERRGGEREKKKKMSERKAGKRHLRAAVLDVSSNAEGHDAEAVASLAHKSSPIFRVFTLRE